MIPSGVQVQPLSLDEYHGREEQSSTQQWYNDGADELELAVLDTLMVAV